MLNIKEYSAHERLEACKQILGVETKICGDEHIFGCTECISKGGDTHRDNFRLNVRDNKYDCFANKDHTHKISKLIKKYLEKKEAVKIKVADNDTWKVKRLNIVDISAERQEFWSTEKKILNPDYVINELNLKGCRANQCILFKSGERYKLFPLDGRCCKWDLNRKGVTEKKYIEASERKDQKKLLLIEGFSNICSLIGFKKDFPAFFDEYYVVTSLNGVSSTLGLDEQVDFSSFEEIDILLDNDKAGNDQAEKIKKKHSKAKIIKLQDEDLRDFLDRDIENFKKLVEVIKITPSEPDETNQSATMKLVTLIMKKIKDDGDELFLDQMENPYLRIKMNNNYQIIDLGSHKFKNLLTKIYWDNLHEAIGRDSVSTVVNTLSGIAQYEGEKYSLAPRIASHESSILYDLRNEDGNAVKITKDSCEIISDIPILFKSYPHQKKQCTPLFGGDLKLIFKYINIRDKNTKLLFLIWLIAAFIPDIPHPILNIYGPQGSCKSTLMDILKSCIDPSTFESSSIKNNVNETEIAQLLSHHYFMGFDNTSKISPQISDLLCRVVTGYSHNKRGLYTNDEDFVYTFKRLIAINGISVIAQRPDFLDRCILIPLDRVPENKRKPKEEVVKDFELDKPKILGGIFNVISKAMKIKEAIKVKSLPRMADFALWGCAIAIVLGYNKNSFLKAYKSNIQQKDEEIINANPLLQLILEFMNDKAIWFGNMTSLKQELISLNKRNKDRSLSEYLSKFKQNKLSEMIHGELKPVLESKGIIPSKQSTKASSRMHIIKNTNMKESIDVIDKSLNNSGNDKNDRLPKPTTNSNNETKSKDELIKHWFQKEANND